MARWVPFNQYHDREPVTCERCGASNLYWRANWRGKPVLCESEFDTLHECEHLPASADEFEDLTNGR
jgi:hypothetical protein